jgi:phosphonate transport system substrate-binding protein
VPAFLRTVPLCLFLLLLFFSSGCTHRQSTYIDFSKPQENTAVASADSENHLEQRPLLIALASVISPKETIGYYRAIAQHVAKATGRPTVLIQRKTYAEVNMLMSNGEVDIAFLSTGAYASYRGMNEIELLVMAERSGNSLYTPDVIVHRDSEFQSLEDLQGRTFAFTDPLSFSGHMVIEDYLSRQNTVPEKYFKRFFYTYNHDKSLWAVANHLVDGASIDSQIYEYAKLRNPSLTEKIRIISSLKPSPTGPVAISKRVPPEQKEALQQIFLKMNQTPETADAMQQLIIDRFVLPQPELYAPLKKIYDRSSVIL